MSDPLTDYHRHSPPPVHPGLVGTPDDDLGSVIGILAGFVACVLGTASALVLGAAVVLAVGAVTVVSADRPAGILAVMLAVPEVRVSVAESWAGDVAKGPVPLTESDRAALGEALDDVLASPDVLRELRQLGPEGDRIDGTELVAAFSSELRAASAGAPPDVRRVLAETDDELRRGLTEGGGPGSAGDLEDAMRDIRRFVLGAALVLAVPGLVVGALALAVAPRRALTAVLISSGALLLAVVALAPGRFLVERLPGPLSVPGRLLAAVGELAGAGAMWALVLSVAVPPGLWWALRAWRDRRSDVAPTT